MSKTIIKAYFHYGDETFDRLFNKIIYDKLSYLFLNEENINKICCSKDKHRAATYQEINKR